jgi:hypothetical protein
MGLTRPRLTRMRLTRLILTRLILTRRHLALAALLAAAGCASSEPPPPARPWVVDYTHLTPLRLDVAEVVFGEGFRPPLSPPNIDHRMSPEPYAALERMLRDRVQAWGSQGRATVTIADASMTEERLARPGGLAGLVGSHPDARYRLALAVTLDVQGGGALRGGGINGRAEARIERTRTVNDDVTFAARERIWAEMLREAMDDPRGMNVEFEFQVRQALRSLLVPEGTPRPNPAAVEVQELGPPGATPGPRDLAPRDLAPRDLAPRAPDPANPPPGLIPGPGGTPGMGTLGTLPVTR